jgi:hypothetical protein
MSRKSERVKEAVDRANAEARRSVELELQLEQQRQANRELVELLTGAKKQPEPEQDDDVLDEALARKVDERFSKLEERQFEEVRDRELSYLGGEQGEAYQKAIAAAAIGVMRKHQAVGRSIDMLQAEKLAKTAIEAEMKSLHKSGVKSGAIAQEIANAARYYDFLVGQHTAEKPLQKTAGGVNMKKVEEARQKAGAPTIDKGSVNLSGGMDVYNAELKKVKESGVSDDYLRKIGFA